MGTVSAMMTCHEGGIFKMNVFSDKECKVLMKKEDMPKAMQDGMPADQKFGACFSDKKMGYHIVTNEFTRKMGLKLPSLPST